MKTPIRIHRQENLSVERYHNEWYKQFVEYLKNYFDVDYVNYTLKEGESTANIIMTNDIGDFEKHPPLSDVDMIIENLSNGEHVVISFTEYFNSYIVHYMKSPKFKGMILSHFSYHNLYYWLKRDNLSDKLSLVKPWIFPLFNSFDTDYYRWFRDISKLEDGLFFKGSGLDNFRKTINHLVGKNVIDESIVTFKEYLENLSKSKLALSHYQDLDRYSTPYDCPGEFCYRDMEYISIGVPFIRIEYRDGLYNGLYPNHHYVSIPREIAYREYHKHGDEGVANLYIEKYNEIKDEHDFLQSISDNQRKYYDEYVRWPKSADLAFKQLNLQDWIK